MINILSNKAQTFFTYPEVSSGLATIYPTYNSAWKIDMNPKIYACSDKINQVQCSIKNLKIWYQGPVDPNDFLNIVGSTARNPVHFYESI